MLAGIITPLSIWISTNLSISLGLTSRKPYARKKQSGDIITPWGPGHTSEQTQSHFIKCAEALLPLFKAIKDDEFNRGHVIAVCNIVNLHGETTIAEDVLQQLNIPETDLKPMDLTKYDQAAIDNIKKDGRGCAFKSE